MHFPKRSNLYETGVRISKIYQTQSKATQSFSLKFKTGKAL